MSLVQFDSNSIETTSDQDKEDNPTCAKKPKDVKTSRTWTPIDNQNESYLQILTERSQNSPPDYVKINSVRFLVYVLVNYAK